MSREVRWMVLTGDGRHSWLGRAVDPTPERLAATASQLDALSLAGWLAVMKGDYHGEGEPELLVVRRLGALDSDLEAALGLWRAARDAARQR